MPVLVTAMPEVKSRNFLPSVAVTTQPEADSITKEAIREIPFVKWTFEDSSTL